MNRSNWSRFEQLIGEDNIDAFHVMLQGALLDWQGTYDVLFPDTGEYLVDAKQSPDFRQFCAVVKGADGEKRCRECDLVHAEQARREGQCVIYRCHAGLQDIAVPIIVQNEIVAAVFCGQVRLEDPEWEMQGVEQTRRLARELGLSEKELLTLREHVQRVPQKDLELTAQRILRIAEFVSQMIESRLVVKEASKRQTRRRERDDEIARAAADIMVLSSDWADLWLRLEEMLRAVTGKLGAEHGALLIEETRDNGSNVVMVRAVAQMPDPIKSGREYESDDLFDTWEEQRGICRDDFGASSSGTLSWDLQEANTETDYSSYIRVSVPVHLRGQFKGGVVLFFSKEAARDFSLEMDRGILNLVAARVAQAYHNTDLYKAQIVEEDQRRNWIRQISHQIIAPLNGLMGYADNLRQEFKDKWLFSSLFANWPRESVERWRNSLDSVVWTADWAARLTRNMAWITQPKKDRARLPQSQIEILADAPGFFVETARFVQGMARERGLRKVHVEIQTLTELSGKLRIHRELFRQALLNLLDNAVKYSDKGTDIVVDGERTNGHFHIRVTNYGIRLRQEDCDRIFEGGFRTLEAKRLYQAGSGIGLSVAYEIIDLHEGRVFARPSQKTRAGWRTAFTIVVPLAK